mgnify:CR=1 FL=1
MKEEVRHGLPWPSSPNNPVPRISMGRRRDPTGEQGSHLNPDGNGEESVTNEDTLGILEVLPGGSGFIRRKVESYTPGKDDIYVGARVIQKFDLRTGDERVLPVIAGLIEATDVPVSIDTYKAGDLVREVAKVVGGGGGGRPDFAQAGGTDPGRLDAALDAARDRLLASI